MGPLDWLIALWIAFACATVLAITACAMIGWPLLLLVSFIRFCKDRRPQPTTNDETRG